MKKVRNVKSKQIYAMKILNKYSETQDEDLRFKDLSNESEIMKTIGEAKVPHPNIIKVYEIIDDPKHHKSYVILECI